MTLDDVGTDSSIKSKGITSVESRTGHKTRYPNPEPEKPEPEPEIPEHVKPEI
jgi:hypothetical protein